MNRVLFFLLISVISTCVYAEASITINDFYRSASDFDWKSAAIVAAITTAALAVTGAVLLFVFPPAGFLLIGWGSVAAGGVTGAVLIGAALNFSTDVAFDYAYSNVKSEFDYRSFQESSKDMVNLPFPRNSKGGYLYKSVVEEVNEAAAQAEGGFDYFRTTKEYDYHVKRIKLKHKMLGLDEKEATLLSLMLFSDNRYLEAKNISNGYYNDKANPLLGLIYSSSLLYDEGVEYDYAYGVFNGAVRMLQDDSFKAFFYSVFFDRVFYRASSGNLSYDSYLIAIEDLGSLPYSNNRLALQNAFFIRMLAAAKLEQQKIISIHEGARSVWRSDGAVEFLASSLDNHILLIESIYENASILEEQILKASSSRMISRLSSAERAAIESINDIRLLVEDYRSGYEGLRVRINDVHDHAGRGFIRRIFD